MRWLGLGPLGLVLLLATTSMTRAQPATPAPPATTPLPIDSVLTFGAHAQPPRAEQEKILAALIEQTPDSEHDEKADYLFRLAELYVRQLLTSSDPAAAKRALLKAVKTFRVLLDGSRAFATYPQRDRALLLFGYALQRGKYLKEARAVYQRLAADHPDSPYVAEALVATADLLAGAGQQAAAEPLFVQAAASPRTHAGAYASYRLARIRLEQQRIAEAVEALLVAIRTARGDAQLRALEQSARSELTHAVDALGPPDRAIEAARRLPAPASLELLGALAELYVEQRAFEHSVPVHRELLRAAPKSPQACRWQAGLSRALVELPSAGRAQRTEAVVQLVAIAATTLEPGATRSLECQSLAVALVRDLAATYVAEQAPEPTEHAERLYRTYLTRLPGGPEREHVADAYGQLLVARARAERRGAPRREHLERAAGAYGIVVAAAPDDSMRAAAASAGADLLVELLATAAVARVDIRRTRARAARRAVALAANARDQLALLQQFRGVLHDERLLAEIDLAEAALWHQHHEPAKALPLVERYVQDHLESPRGELAVILLLDTLIALRQYGDVEVLVSELVAEPSLVSGKPALARHLAAWRRVAR